MANFHQEGIVVTLHGLYAAFDRDSYLARLEVKLEDHARKIGIGLLLPVLYSEIQNSTALERILDELTKVRYLHSVVIALGGANEQEQFQKAKEYFARLKTSERDVKVIWTDGQQVQEVVQEIQKQGLNTGVQGKGQSVWIALGYLFARSDINVIALHDCDVVTYDRIFLGRLILPIANRDNVFDFCKGYYPRISIKEKTVNGRVTRLFVTPFCDTMATLMQEKGHHEVARFFNYHKAFKYPLAGEISLTVPLARSLDVASGWGFEVAVLSEVYHRTHLRRIAQVALSNNYEHKHQNLSPNDSTKGLHRMVVDIAEFYFSYMRSHGLALGDPFVDMICHTYFENTRRFIKMYSDDADINDLSYDRNQEELTARYFLDFIKSGWSRSKENPNGTMLPSWNRVLYAIPGIYAKVLRAVEDDNS